MFDDNSVCNSEIKCCCFPATQRNSDDYERHKRLSLRSLAASGGFASWFQSGVPAERRRRQLPIGSASLLQGDGWACHAPSPRRCNWGFSCCGTTRFVFPRGEKLRVASCARWKHKVLAGSLVIRTHSKISTEQFNNWKNEQTNKKQSQHSTKEPAQEESLPAPQTSWSCLSHQVLEPWCRIIPSVAP